MGVNKNTASVSDADFMRGISDGSDDLIGRLYKLYYPMVHQLILTNSGSEQDAKDNYQESMIVLFEKVREGNFILSCSLKTYIYAVSKRLWLKKLQHIARFPLSQEWPKELESEALQAKERLMADGDVSHHLEKEEHFKALASSLVKLGEPCKTLIEDFYMNEQSMVDICKKFGYTSTDNAKNQKYKCMVRLKKLFFIEYGRTAIHS